MNLDAIDRALLARMARVGAYLRFGELLNTSEFDIDCDELFTRLGRLEAAGLCRIVPYARISEEGRAVVQTNGGQDG